MPPPILLGFQYSPLFRFSNVNPAELKKQVMLGKDRLYGRGGGPWQAIAKRDRGYMQVGVFILYSSLV